MFCIQDPSYDNSKYLHETLLAECTKGVFGAGVFAFATKDGINLLLADDNFKHFVEVGKFTLVIGTDEITNEHSINSLLELKKKYGENLQIKAYVHNEKGSTFHPKFTWFKNSEGGTLILGSGNLTQRGLRHNREAYYVVKHDEKEMKTIVEEWERWYTHSAPFLFDIDDPIVIAKAKLNSKKSRATSIAKVAIQRGPENISEELKRLAEIYKNQPKDKKEEYLKKGEKTEFSKENLSASNSFPPITDEELDVDCSYWTIDNDSSVLIAEIPKSGNRWKQANFDKDTFENYFGATCGKNGEYRILLKNVKDDGSMGETEVRPSVSVSSKNYRFELEAANGLEYPSNGERPIAIFAKVSCRDFIYSLVMPEQENYSKIMLLVERTEASSTKMRRLRYIAKDVVESIPDLAIWKRLEKEEGK